MRIQCAIFRLHDFRPVNSLKSTNREMSSRDVLKMIDERQIDESAPHGANGGDCLCGSLLCDIDAETGSDL